VADVCRSIHKDFVQQFKHAIVWGTSAKHQPQRVGLSTCERTSSLSFTHHLIDRRHSAAHVLEDEDVIQLMKK